MYKEISVCRSCQSNSLQPVLDLGSQSINGFPLPEEPDPPKVPLLLVLCGECQLLQLKHTTNGDLLYREFWYRCLGSRQKVFARVNGRLVHEQLKWVMRYEKVELPRVAEDGTIHWALVLNRVKGRDHVYEIHLTTGAVIYATEQHRWRRFGTGSAGSMCWERKSAGNPGAREEVLVPTSALEVGDKIPVAHNLQRPIESVDHDAIYDYRLGQVVGLYIAEGCRNKTGAMLTFNISKDDAYIEALRETVTGRLHDGMSIRPEPSRSIKSVYLSGPMVMGLLNKFVAKHGSLRKHFTADVWSQPLEFIRGIVDGWLQGDGSRLENNGRWQFNIGANRALIDDLRLACTLIGYRFRCARYTRADGTKCYHGWVRPNAATARQQRALGDLGYATIRRIRKPPAKHITWDIEIGSTGLFVLGNGVVTHNSAITQTMRDALGDVVMKASERVDLASGDTVIDIGSNDSTLLENWPAKLDRIGFEPATNLMEEAHKPGLTVVNDYFSLKALREVSGKKAKVITAIAMFYDLDAPVQFCMDVWGALADDGVFVIQQAYLPDMLRNNDIGNVCHEHLSYQSLHSLETILNRAGLFVFDVEQNDINGGSFRVYACKGSHKHRPLSSSLAQMRMKEVAMGLGTEAPYLAFAQRSEILKGHVREFVQKETSSGGRVYVYGASTKGNTMLQYWGLTGEEISGAAERDERKWGRTTPSTRIPIVSELEGRSRGTAFLVLPFHFKKEFLKREEAFLEKGGKMCFPLPQMQIITSDSENLN